MVHGTVRSFFQLLGALAVTGLVLAAWFGYRLSEGPLSLSFLSPYIEDALSTPDGGLTVRLDQTVLAWSHETRTLEIRAEGVRAVSRDQTVIASVPEMLVSLSGPALLRGQVAPRRLNFLHPSIRLVRDAQGRLRLGMGEGATAAGQAPLAAFDAIRGLFEPPGGDAPGGQLQGIEIRDGDLVVADAGLGIQWHAPRTDLWFVRDQRGITGHARIELQLAGESARFDADAVYSNAERAAETTLSFGGIRPALIATLAPQLGALGALHLPTGGKLGLRYSLDQGLTDLRFDVVGGEGVIDASPWAGVSWPVQSVAVKGALDHGLNDLALDELRVDLGGPLITVNGTVADLSGAAAVKAAGHIDNLPVDTLKGLWPPELAPNPRAWILANLSHGSIRRASAEVSAHLPPGKGWDDLAVDQVGGELAPEGVTVGYLPPMPPVQNVNATASFDANAFTIDVKSGEVMGLKVQEGKVVLSGLSAPDQIADITLKIGGPVGDALRLIDSKPLGWAQALGVQPAKAKGDATTTLSLRFPLLQDLNFDQMKVRAQAQTSHFALPNAALGLDLSEGALALDVDPKGMDVVGKAQLGGLPADIKWRENFTKGVFRSRYEVSATLDDAARKMVGLDAAPFQPPLLSGPVPVEVTALMTDAGTGDVDIRANLLPAAMQLPSLNWDKRPGIGAQAAATLHLDGGHLADLPRLAVTAADGLDIQGLGSFDGGKLRRLTFRRAKWGRTDVAGTMLFGQPDGGITLDLSGASFDAREMVAGEPSDHATDSTAAKPETRLRKPERHDLTPLAVQARFAQVWVSDDGVLKAVNANMARDHRDWHHLRIDGTVGADQPFRAEIQPAGPNRRSLKVTSGDAGDVLRSFGIFDNVVGGRLAVDGSYDDADAGQPLKGTATISDYQVVKAPALARLLTVASLTGIVEVLQGQGINFSSMEVPFVLTDGVLAVNDARAAGTALGITAKGQVDLDNDRLALEGTVVPVYALNSAFGNIPIVGPLFSNEKGGGVFAMNYSMRGPSKDPEVSVNPLSAFTPGMLRRLFDIFGTGTDVRPKDRPAE